MEHCVRPLGVGTLIVKPDRHVVHVADLTDDETDSMGQVLSTATRVVSELTNPEQVYVTLWSHAGRRPGHIHYVVQPVSQALMERHDSHGPELQVRMFGINEKPDPDAVEQFAGRARGVWERVERVS